MHTNSPRLAHRAALLLADAAAFVVSRFRPLSMHTTPARDEHGEPLQGPVGAWLTTSERNVFVLPLVNASPWRFDVWRDEDAGPTGCLHIDAFGFHVEVYYVRKPAQQPA